MIFCQIRPWGVLDARIIDALSQLSRAPFIPDASLRVFATIDRELPLLDTRYTLPPRVEARLLQEANIARGMRVAVLGDGAGYTAALASFLTDSVSVYESDPALCDHLRSVYAHRAETQAITVEAWNPFITAFDRIDAYDVIISVRPIVQIPSIWQSALRVGACFLALCGTPPLLTAVRFDKDTDGIREVALFETNVREAPIRIEQ